MSEQEPPKIEFPCENYSIRVMGTAGQAFQQFVLDTFEKHSSGFDRAKVQIRPSSKGNYESVVVTITATGEAQLKALFEDLKTSSDVKMVL